VQKLYPYNCINVTVIIVYVEDKIAFTRTIDARISIAVSFILKYLLFPICIKAFVKKNCWQTAKLDEKIFVQLFYI